MDSVGDLVASVTVPLATAAIGAIAIVLFQRWDFARRWFLARPLRRAAETGGSKGCASALGDALLSAESGASGASVLVAAMRLEPRLAERSSARQSASLLRSVMRPGAHGLIPRLVFGEEERSVVRRAGEALDALGPFERVDELDPSIVLAGSGFARWATSVTGAPILLDSLDSRSRIAHDVHVWHRTTYAGHPSAIGRTYDECHSSPCHAAAVVQQPGDYDGRVLTLDACSYVEDPAYGTLSFVLETSETCYAATEQGNEPWGCKHLPEPSGLGVGLRFEGASRLRRTGERLCLLTSYIVVLTGDRQLVLCRRSSAVRSGPGVVSASAGGVCEPGDGVHGDRDPLGWPDLIVSGQRELREELGVDVDRQSIRPAALFLANSTNPFKNDEGQLVASLLSVVRIGETFEQVRDNLWSRSDLAAGSFEVDDLIALSMEGSAADLMDRVEPVLGELDQHGALSVIYSAAVVWGREAARMAYEELIERAGQNPLLQRRYVDPEVLVARPANPARLVS